MSERKEELEGKLSSAASLAYTWKSFMEHPGWKLYSESLQEQIRLRQTTVCFTPVNSQYTPYTQEFYKGEAVGMSTALEMPQTQFEEADMQRRVLTKELEIEDDSEKQTARADVSRVDDPDAFGE